MPYLDDGTFVLVRPYVRPTIPAPEVRSVSVDPADARVPRTARTLIASASGVGRCVVTFARGTYAGLDGAPAASAVMEPTGEWTEGTDPKPKMKGGKPTGEMTTGTPPKPAMKKVGEIQKPPVDSIRVVILADDGMRYVAYWIDGAFDFGMLFRGRTFVQQMGISEMKKVVKDAASRADVRDTQLPLEGV